MNIDDRYELTEDALATTKGCQNPECIKCYGVPPYTQEQIDVMNAAYDERGVARPASDVYYQLSDTTAKLIDQIIERDAHGKKKYGVTLDRTDLSLLDWLQHQIEELSDAAGYALAAKREAGKLLDIRVAAHWLVIDLSEHVPGLKLESLDRLTELLQVQPQQETPG